MWNKIKKRPLIRCVIILGGAAVLFLIIGIAYNLIGIRSMPEDGGAEPEETAEAEPRRVPRMDFDVKLLTPNRFSRPQLALKQVNAVVVHYTSNPGTSAMENRNYFNNLPRINEDRTTPTFASSHFVIGLEGEIVQCIPLAEMAYASNDRNSDTVAIECCHPTKSGQFNEKTCDSLLNLLVYLCLRYGLDPATDIIRHYDVTGKMCPRYYVRHPAAWRELVANAVRRTERVRKELEKPGSEYDLFDQNGKLIES